MIRNPLARHIALFLAVKFALIALGLWWFFGGGLPEPRGAVPASSTTRPNP